MVLTRPGRGSTNSAPRPRATSSFSVTRATSRSSPGGFSDGARTSAWRISVASSGSTCWETRLATSEDMHQRYKVERRERSVTTPERSGGATTPERSGGATSPERSGGANGAGVRLHVVETGPQDGTPVLFLHGFPEFWWSWRHQLDALGAA